MADNKQIAHEVLELVGGGSNVVTATNCMTRLRLTVHDQSKVDVEAIKKVTGVIGCQWSGAQLQVIIGQNVPKVLEAFCAEGGIAAGKPVDENLDADLPKEKLTLGVLGNRVLDYLSGSMTQLIPLIMAGGLFRTFAVVLGPQLLGLIAEDSATYTFFYTTLYEAAFYFLPIYLGYAAAKKIGASPMLGMLTGGLLIAPTIVSAASAGENISVYGISIAASDYSQSVLPIMLAVVLLYFVEKFFKKHMPDALSTIFTPFCTMIVVVPITLIVLAPIGNGVGQLIATFLFWLADLGGLGSILVRGVLGAFWQLFVVAGMHMPVILLAINQIAVAGYDPIIFVSTNSAMFAVWGCALGAFLRIKNKEEKSMCMGYVVAAVMGGVTEPALFGVNLRWRGTLLGMFAGGAVSSILAGFMGVTYYMAGGGTNFLVFLNYLQGGMGNVAMAIVCAVVAVVIAAIVTYLFGFSQEELEELDAA